MSETTYGYNQKVFLNYTGSQSDVSWTFNQGNYVFSGSNLSAQRIISFGTPIKDHVFLVDVSYDGTPDYAVRCDGYGVFTGPTIYKHTSTNVNNYYVFFRQGFTITNEKLFLQIIDLTDWYGAGKEPSTVQEFKNKFTQTYFPTQITPLQLTEYQINHIGPIYGYNQKFYPMTSLSNWVSNASSVVYNSDGSMTVTMTTNANYSGTQMSSSKASAFYANHKYFYSCWYYADTIAGNGASSGLNLYSTGSGYVIQEAQQYPEKTWYKDEKIFTVSKNSSGTIYPWIFINQRGDRNVGDKVTLKDAEFIDLTYWYGAGNEPTTVKEFKDTFYKAYYPTQTTVSYLNKYAINNL